MQIEQSLNEATRRLYANTNVAGRLHAAVSVEAFSRRADAFNFLASRANSRSNAVQAQVGATVNRYCLATMRSLKPFHDAVDFTCGTNKERLFATSIPQTKQDWRDNFGILGTAAMFYFPLPTPPYVARAVSAAVFLGIWIGIAVGCINLAIGTPAQVAFEHACELAAWFNIRVQAQVIALLGFTLKAVPLAVAAIAGTVIGIGRDPADPIRPPLPESRARPCTNTYTLLGDELALVPDKYFIRLDTGHGFDIRELARHNETRLTWTNPATDDLQPLSERDVDRLVRHRSNVGQRLLAHRNSVAGAAGRLPAAVLDALRAAAGGLSHAADESRKEEFLVRLVDLRDSLDERTRQDFERVMVSDTGEDFATILRRLNPGGSLFWAGGCANGIRAYFAERANFIAQHSKAEV